MGSNPIPSAILTEDRCLPLSGRGFFFEVETQVRYHIWTMGCQMNRADSAKLAAGLDRLGHEPVDSPEEADLVVINTCVVREHAERRAASKLGELKRLKSGRNGLKVVLTGCMVGPRTADLQRRFPHVDVFAPPQAFADIIAAIDRDDRTACSPSFWTATFPSPVGPTACVPVTHGCNKFCTYCIVPYRRGREHSRPIADVRHEVEHLVAGGVREVTLLGQSVEAYGRDLPTTPDLPTGQGDLADLMRDLHEIEGLERIRFLTSYPADVTDRIIDAVAELPKVCECFSLPLQSGDDEMLARMRRGYTADEYRAVVERIRRRIPKAAISTDIIVGFCGETDEQFQHSYDLLKELRFDKVHVAAYSPRPGTIAARTMADDVPPEVKAARLQAVESLEARIAGEINVGLAGSVQNVLVEERRKRKWSGRARSDKLVHFTGACRVGDVISVRIEKTSPWSLQGKAIAKG
jgi:tRNA-2-methylthio-N6-dimethylallyladenosine synthase